MATTAPSLSPSPSIPTQVLRPHTAPVPVFAFTPHLQSRLPALGQPTKVTRPLCLDFLANKCREGPRCPKRHYVPKEERSGIGHLICKHYQRGLCKKGGACEFAHTFNLRDERECKEFSRFGLCPQGEDCTYLHVAPTSELRRPPCPQYKRGFCPLGSYCGLRHVKHARLCPFYLAGFCPTGRTHPPDSDRVVSCGFGAHAPWIKDEDLHPRRPEVRKPKDPAVERKEQEEREEEFALEEQRRIESAQRGEATGRWTNRVGRQRGRARGGFPGRRY